MIEEKHFQETGNGELVLLSGPDHIHEMHFIVRNFLLTDIKVHYEPINL